MDVCVRAEIAGAVAINPPRNKNARVRLVRDHDIGVALIVLKADIVARLVRLDEVCLEDERLNLRIGRDDFHVGSFLDHRRDARLERLRSVEILADSIAQVLRFPYIEHRPLPVLELINSRQRRQVAQLLLQRDLFFGKRNHLFVVRHRARACYWFRRAGSIR